MLLSALLLLLVCGSQADNYYGTVMTYYPKDMTTNGSLLVNVRYKLSFAACAANDTWSCSGNCGSETADVELSVVEESPGEWCQREGVATRLVSGTAPFQLSLDGGNWITGIINSIVSWRAVTDVELSFRSDSNQINTSPVTTILPALRIPSNCPRNVSLLAFDPDGDEVKCRNGMTSASECNPCTPPSVLNLSSSCTLSFSPTNSSNEGPYAVQLVMEDFPRQNINLVQPDGSSVPKTTNEAISKIPVQFVLKVDPAVPSCSEGVYLPRFLSPTPDHGAQILTNVNQAVEINIRAEATQSTISGLLFSGPHNVVKNSQALGNFTLTWTPSNFESRESHPICFVVQSSLASSVYQSDLRCVTVKVGNSVPTTTMPPMPTTTTYPETTMPPMPTTTTYPETTMPPMPPTTTYPETTMPPMPTTTTYPETTMPPMPTTTTYPETTMPPTTTYPETTMPTTTTYPETTMPPMPPTTTYPETTMPPMPPTTTYPETTMPPMPPTTTYPETTMPPMPTTTTYPETTMPPMPTTTTYPETTMPPMPTTTTYPETTMPPTTTYPETTMPPTTTYPETTMPTTTTYPETTMPTTTTYPETTMPPMPTTTTYPETTMPPMPTTTTYPETTLPPMPTTTTYPETTMRPRPTTTIQLPTTTVVFPTTVPTTTHIPTTTTAAPTAPTTTTVVFGTVPPVMPPPTQTSAPTTPPPTSTSDPGPYYVMALNAKISTTLSLENDYNTIIQLIKNELTDKGLPQNIIVTIRRKGALEMTTAAP
ncbi:mucin-2-like [Xiphophorus maculatus]|uniref:mucin-2-like n=1 Tax=Xiphophorus maculatus TaxID=8083 RepID=UPI000C6E0934|nr:mucin-2-like [Xiphophorus maculatus]